MKFRMFAVYFAPDGAPSGTTAPAEPAAPSPAPAPAATPAPSGAGPGSPAAPADGTTKGGFTYSEDRGEWIPPYRYKQLNDRATALQRAYEEAQGRVKALAGFGDEGRGGTTRSPEQERLRSALLEILPELNDMDELRTNATAGRTMEGIYWQRHAYETGRNLVETYAKASGADAATLPPSTMRRLTGIYQQYIAEDRSGERTYRYENNDPKLISEFMAELTGVFIEPHRRTATTAAATTVETNRRLPQVGPRGGVPPSEPAAKLRGKDLRNAAREFVRKQSGG